MSTIKSDGKEYEVIKKEENGVEKVIIKEIKSSKKVEKPQSTSTS